MDLRSDLSIIIPNHREVFISLVESRCKHLYPNAQIIVANDPDGKGKCWALREGWTKSNKEIIVFIDGDMDIEPEDIEKLLKYIDTYDIVVAKKSLEKMPLKRKILSLGYRWLVKILFQLPISDTQTGLKVFNRYALYHWNSDGFCCDIEILSGAHKRDFTIKEVEINVFTSKEKGLKTICTMLLQTVTLWYRSLFQS